MGNNQSISGASLVHRRATGTRSMECIQARTTETEATKSSDSDSDYVECTEGATALDQEHGSEVPNKILLADDSSSSDDEADANLSALDRLLLKQRRERMLELQSIQEQNKRVSDGKHCKRLDRFFSRAQNGDNQAETDSISSESDASTTSANQSSVVLEVRGLFQSQPVTSVLGSESFRSQLDGIIRGNLIRQEREMETALRLRNAGLPGNTVSGRPLTETFVPTNLHEEASTQSSSTHSSVNIHPSSAATAHIHGNLIPTPPPPPPPPGIINQFMPIPNEYQPGMAYQQPYAGRMQAQPSYPVPNVQHANPQVPYQQGHSVGGVVPQPPWLVDQANQRNSLLADIHQVHRESIITEISNLVQSQLVTSTLESNFRGQLEVMLENRASMGGGDRQHVVDFIQRLPRTEHIVRNDFSHLGINRSGVAEGGTSQPFQSSSNYNMAQEMAMLRSQMAELQNMVKVSFDLQLDLQRSIRQEVAAALHDGSQVGNSAGAAAVMPNNREVHPAKEGHCIICLDKSIDSVLYQCGHMCVCLTCGLRLKDLGSHCPMCRAPIRDVIRAYKCHEQ